MVTVSILSILPLSYGTQTIETIMSIINPLTGTTDFTFYINTTSVGQKFIANITVTNVVDLWNWQYFIKWDPQILNISRAYIPQNNVFKGRTIVTPTPVINYKEGTVKHGAVILSGDTFTGSGTLAQIEFIVIKAPLKGQVISCNISFSRPYGEDTFLLDSNFNTIPAILQDAKYSFIWPRPQPPTAIIYIDPPKIMDPFLSPSSQFKVNVSIKNVAYLAMFEFKVQFNASLIEVKQLKMGNIIPSNATYQFRIDNGSGYTWLSVILPSYSLVYGNGTLAEITFHVKGFGSTVLHLYDVYLVDDLSRPIPFITFDGSFNNVLLAMLSVEPREIIDPSLVPFKTFTVNITVDDVENLYGYRLNITFNPKILSIKTLDIHTLFNDTNFDLIFYVNNRYGFAWVELTYYPPATPKTTYDPIPLISITFIVKDYGSTIIGLRNTSLIDESYNAIAHEIHDGLFKNFKRNVAVTCITISRTRIYQGIPVKVNVTVKNKGDLEETFNVSIYCNNLMMDIAVVTNLEPGKESVISFTLSTSNLQPCQNYLIAAWAAPVPNEVDVIDNYLADGELKVKLMGDVNEDHLVNMEDIGLIIKSFGSYPGSPNWNAEADLNGSGFIDMKDVALAISNFGKSCL